MNIRGTWYMNPGDIPADFAVPVTLGEDGLADWADRPSEPYSVEAGLLVIGDPSSDHMVFDLTRAGSDFLSGVMKSAYEPEDEEDLATPGPHFFTDAAILLREPGDLRILG